MVEGSGEAREEELNMQEINVKRKRKRNVGERQRYYEQKSNRSMSLNHLQRLKEGADCSRIESMKAVRYSRRGAGPPELSVVSKPLRVCVR